MMLPPWAFLSEVVNPTVEIPDILQCSVIQLTSNQSHVQNVTSKHQVRQFEFPSMSATRYYFVSAVDQVFTFVSGYSEFFLLT